MRQKPVPEKSPIEPPLGDVTQPGRWASLGFVCQLAEPRNRALLATAGAPSLPNQPV